MTNVSGTTIVVIVIAVVLLVALIMRRRRRRFGADAGWLGNAEESAPASESHARIGKDDDP